MNKKKGNPSNFPSGNSENPGFLKTCLMVMLPGISLKKVDLGGG